MANLRPEFFNIVAVALLTKFAEAAEILADLRSGDIHFLPQGMRRDADDTAGA